MSVFAAAVQREEWEVVAHCLLIGLAKVAVTVPPETLVALVELLEVRDERQR